LEIISTSALEPWASDGVPWAAPLSGCSWKTKAAIKIGVHLIFNGIRRRTAFQVIDLVPHAVFGTIAAPAGAPFMLCCARIVRRKSLIFQRPGD
jgi:hypothetical protein